MAEIPVHKKSNLGWLWWLLGLLLLGLLLWWLLTRDDDSEVVNEPVATEQTAPLVADDTVALDNQMMMDNTMAADGLAGAANGGVITDYNQLASTDLDGVIGRKVAFQNVPVESVTDDMGFWIGDSKAHRTYVAFREYPSPNNPKMEGNVDVNNPSRVMIEGEVVKSTGQPAPGIVATIPKDITSYIRASKVAVVNNR